ncbi:MAG: hypothetical protein E7287_02725 [Lachnospiraceae bacterium]|nr:hypothetical protein [Lachnospiraceae bacterium]
MKNAKQKIIFILIMLSVVGILSFGYVLFSRNKDEQFSSDKYVNKYKWMKMLCEQVGMTEFENDIPYFTDVDIDNKYFPYIQSAVEWGVLDGGDCFDGKSAVVGRDIAITAMKVLGHDKVQIYLETNEEITDDMYITVALETGLIEAGELTEKFTRDECREVLEYFDKVYFTDFWIDDYFKTAYQKDVMELPSTEVLQNNDDYTKLFVKDNSLSDIEVGNIIILEQKNTGIKVARKVMEINDEGAINLSPVDLSEVVETLTVSDITELTFADIVDYYGLNEVNSLSSNLSEKGIDANVLSTSVFSIDAQSKGFKLALSTESEDDDKYLQVKLIDNNTGLFYVLPLNVPIAGECNFAAEIDVDKLLIGGQVDYSIWKGGLQYADVALDAHATLSGSINVQGEQKLLLCKTPVPLGNGFVGVDVSIYLVLTADGGISFDLDIPIEASVNYEKDKGIRKFEHQISAQRPTIEANCEIGMLLRMEPVLTILGCLDVIDVEADMGLSVSVSIINRSNTQICTDIKAAFPIISVSVCGDEDVNSLIGALGLSASWDIVSAESAPFKMGFHYEVRPDETAQFVKRCTFEEQKEKKIEVDDETETELYTYHTRYGEVNHTDTHTFYFDYPQHWKITKEEIEGSSTFWGEYAEEFVELTNDRGITIRFIMFEDELYKLGGRGRLYTEYEATQMSESQLTPLIVDDLSGDYVVAKFRRIGEMISETDSELQTYEKEYICYALLDWENINIGVKNMGAFGSGYGFEEMVSFNYPNPCVFYAKSPDGTFTEQEEKEVIEILASFRTQ